MLLDTNIVSESWRSVADHRVLNWLDEQKPHDLFICSFVVSELLYGIERLQDGVRRRSLLKSFGDLVDYHRDRVLSFDHAAAIHYAQIRIERERAGRRIDPIDGMIAAIAIANDMPLITRNVSDFAGLGLAIVNPFDAAT